MPVRRGHDQSAGSLAFLISATTPSASYGLIGCRWDHLSISYNDLSSWYAGPETAAAANSWTNTPTPIVVTWASSPDFYVAAGNFGNDGMPGRTTFGDGCVWNGSHYRFLSGQVWAYYNTYYTEYSSSGAKQAIGAHEMGHALGLGHQSVSGCSGKPLMHPDLSFYLSCGIKTPQGDDIKWHQLHLLTPSPSPVLSSVPRSCLRPHWYWHSSRCQPASPIGTSWDDVHAANGRSAGEVVFVDHSGCGGSRLGPYRTSNGFALASDGRNHPLYGHRGERGPTVFTFGPGQETDQFVVVGVGAGLYQLAGTEAHLLDKESPELPSRIAATDLEATVRSGRGSP